MQESKEKQTKQNKVVCVCVCQKIKKRISKIGARDGDRSIDR